jgi:hypothetical protein
MKVQSSKLKAQKKFPFQNTKLTRVVNLELWFLSFFGVLNFELGGYFA